MTSNEVKALKKANITHIRYTDTHKGSQYLWTSIMTNNKKAIPILKEFGFKQVNTGSLYYSIRLTKRTLNWLSSLKPSTTTSME